MNLCRYRFLYLENLGRYPPQEQGEKEELEKKHCEMNQNIELVYNYKEKN